MKKKIDIDGLQMHHLIAKSKQARLMAEALPKVASYAEDCKRLEAMTTGKFYDSGKRGGYPGSGYEIQLHEALTSHFIALTRYYKTIFAGLTVDDMKRIFARHVKKMKRKKELLEKAAQPKALREIKSYHEVFKNGKRVMLKKRDEEQYGKKLTDIFRRKVDNLPPPWNEIMKEIEFTGPREQASIRLYVVASLDNGKLSFEINKKKVF